MRNFIPCSAALSALHLFLATPAASANETADSPPSAVELDAVEVKAQRAPTRIGPLPGLELSRDQLPGNVQSATREDLRNAQALSLSDFLNRQLQSVNVNDYQGNPFQVDVTYRGFTVGPQIGTPQGLSVFLDGVRVNEPFGDIVNWDLLPLNAIERFDLFPGTNPVFGLNTLGGAISLRTRSGLDESGTEVEASGGSFGRREAQLSTGGHRGNLGGFAALTYFKEDGWRDNSPSELKQGFGKIDYRLPIGTVTASTLLAGNDLVGNGLVPTELYEQHRSAVFTSPDETRNRLTQFNLSGLFALSEHWNLSAQTYHRNSRRKGVNGDLNEDFEDFGGDDLGNLQIANPNANICRYADTNGDGRIDTLPNGQPTAPLNDPFRQGLCQNIDYVGTPRNGGNAVNPATGVFGTGSGVVDGTPIGVLTRTSLGQTTDGGTLQLNANLHSHRFLVGAAYDDARARYDANQQLALIDAAHRVYTAPDQIDPIYRAAQVPVTINRFNGSSRTFSLYFSETWSAADNLHFTLSGRYNADFVHNNLDARLGGDLSEIRNRRPTFILCPTNDLASCPDSVGPLIINDLSRETLAPTQESFTYRSFNPSLGFNWLPIPTLNLFGSLSRGARAPSVIELGCAYDGTLVNVAPNGTPVYVPRSLAGPTCSLPTALSGDPYLPQIRSVTGEVGARGSLAAGLQWNLSLYRTDLSNDIYFAGASATRSYFDTVGKTRRQGLELGFSGKFRRFDFKLNYAYTAATFESEFFVLSPHNSSADFNAGTPGVPSPTAGDNRGRGTFNTVRVEPGAVLPGVPLHNGNLSLGYRPWTSLRFGLNAVAHSKSFVRGNENNGHRPEGTDQVTDGIGPVETPGQFNGGRPFRNLGGVPGYVTLSADFNWQLTSELTLYGQITNLLDTEYFTGGRLGVDPFSPSINGAIGPSGFNYNSREAQNTTFVAPGAPRAFFGGIRYSF